MTKDSKTMLNDYDLYWQNLKTKHTLSSDKLISEVKAWQTLKDSTLAVFARDTIRPPHTNYEGQFSVIHDSIRYEFDRLIAQLPRTFKDFVLLKESASPYMNDKELAPTLKESETFFSELAKKPVKASTLKTAIAEYERFLNKTLQSGIADKQAMLAFIQAEDVHFRGFLSHFSQLYDQPIGGINKQTEEICKQVFQAANENKIAIQDVLVYMTIRNNHRLMQNAEVCMNDIKTGKVKSETKARAYTWVMLQPYSTINEVGVAVLSKSDRQALLKLAEETPKVLDTLNRQLHIDNSRMERIAELLIRAYIYTI